MSTLFPNVFPGSVAITASQSIVERESDPYFCLVCSLSHPAADLLDQLVPACRTCKGGLTLLKPTRRKSRDTMSLGSAYQRSVGKIKPAPTLEEALAALPPYQDCTQIPSSIWDDLPYIPLCHRALREFDRRASRSSRFLESDSVAIIEHGERQLDLRLFARHGGPDLSWIRGYPKPAEESVGWSLSAAGLLRVITLWFWYIWEARSFLLFWKSPINMSTSPYDPVFEQLLICQGIYPAHHSRSATPRNLEALKARLRKSNISRPSFHSVSLAFSEFQDTNNNANSENDVLMGLMHILLGGKRVLHASNIEFRNLVALTRAKLTNCKPDYYEGSNPNDLDEQVKRKLRHVICPSSNESRPWLPNFFIEVKGPDGSAQVARRQACYDGATGARAMHFVRMYIDEETALDDDAHTITAIYVDGYLTFFATHVTACQSSGRLFDYHMTKLQRIDMTEDVKSFRQGLTAMLNAREWAQEQRTEAISAANRKVQAGQ